MSNPFADLRPPRRSEEDEIRKGIFSQALRNLLQATLKERQAWCCLIREGVAGVPLRGKAVRGRDSGQTSSGNAASTSPNAATTKRQREDDTATTNPECEISTTGATGTTIDDRGSRENGPAPGGAESTAAVSNRPDTVAVAAPELQFTAEEAREYVAAFMRGLLDRVMGSSLNSLNIHSLRVLCAMLGIETMARSKIVLYSMLASFYYTECEKLGKRVSRDTIYERQVQQEVEMLRHAARGTATTTAAKKEVTQSPAVATVSALKEKATDSMAGSSVKVVPRKARTKSTPVDEAVPRPTMVSQQQHVERMEDDDDGDRESEVDYGGRVFARPTESHSTYAAAKRDADGAGADDAEWSMQYLERKVASIVQLYDPVTVAIVVKRLAQMGYRGPNAAAVVEKVLHCFHERQLIFYDNGIAYLM